MGGPSMRLNSARRINRGAKALAEADPRLDDIIGQIGKIPSRLSEPGFAGMAAIITSQQVSKASADAIFSRLKAAISPLDAENFLAAGQKTWRAAGLSAPKQRTLEGLAETVANGALDLETICDLPPEAAMEKLTALKGIGPWTAEIYLMFCAGHSDIFPAGDLALQEAIRMGFNMRKRPDEKKCRKMAKKWSPWRSVAARIFWEYYRLKKRDGTPAGG